MVLYPRRWLTPQTEGRTVRGDGLRLPPTAGGYCLFGSRQQIILGVGWPRDLIWRSVLQHSQPDHWTIAVGDMYPNRQRRGLKAFADLKPQLAQQQQCLAIDPGLTLTRATPGGLVLYWRYRISAFSRLLTGRTGYC